MSRAGASALAGLVLPARTPIQARSTRGSPVSRAAGWVLAGLLLLPGQPAHAQNFFERLFGPPPGQPQPYPGPPRPGYYQQPPQYRPQPQAPAPAPAQPQPQRRSPQAQPQQPRPSAPANPQAPPAAQQAQPAPVPEPPPAPYEGELLRLAEIIGSLAFLRSLCATADAPEWPARMQALLEAEGTTAGRRERLAGAYNKGYRAYSLTYRACTPSAGEATVRYVQEGDQLSRTLAGRYGG